MTLPNLKELEKLIKLCRKQGLSSLRAGTIEFTLKDIEMPAPRKRNKAGTKGVLPQEAFAEQHTIQDDGPSEEDLLFWSAGSGQESS